MKHAVIILTAFIFAAALAGPAPAAAQDYVMTIRDGQPAISMALPAFAASDPVRAAAEEIHDVLEADLKYTRIFQLLPKSYYSYIGALNPQAIQFKDWESIQAAVLFVGSVSRAANGDILCERNFYDVKSQRTILSGKRYQVKPADLRFLAHKMADEILKAYGEKAVFATKIAFVSDRDGNDELYMMDYDGAKQERLTFNKVIDYMPAWSPDAARIAYTSFQNLAAGLYILDVYAGRRTAISVLGNNNSASWAPDGKRLAFVSTMDGNSEIYVTTFYEDKTFRTRRLTNNPAVDTAPTWSPNGRELAFTSDRGGTPQIYIMDAEGGNIRRISFGASHHDSPAWCPTGDRIVYIARVDNLFDLYVYNIRTGGVQKLTESNARNESPSWSPDGRHIVFASNMRGSVQLFSIDSDGANLRQLTTKGNNKLPDWSN